MQEFTERTVYAPTTGAYYVPFVSDDGRVGYRVGFTNERAGEESFLYFNPSEEDSEQVPNVFVYLGPENDPSVDDPQHFYRV